MWQKLINSMEGYDVVLRSLGLIPQGAQIATVLGPDSRGVIGTRSN